MLLISKIISCFCPTELSLIREFCLLRNLYFLFTLNSINQNKITMKKLEKLTSEQESKMYEVRDFWLNYINSCTNSVDKEKAIIGINWLYEGIKKKAPQVFFVASPMGCQIAVHYLKEISKDTANVWANVRVNVGDNVRVNVWANVRDNVWDNVRDNVRDNVGDNVWDNVWDNVRDNVRDNVWANVGDNVWANVGGNVGGKIKFEYFASYGSISDYGWVSFYDFFTQIGVLNHDGFNKFKNLISSGIYDMIQMDGVCVVCDLPKKLLRNENQQLHCLDGYAIEFKDGYGQYYVNGRSISEKYFKSILDKTFSMEDFINESNEEYKSTCIAFIQEKHGEEYLVEFFRQNLQEVDTFVDKKYAEYLKGTTGGMNVGVYTLFKGEINNEKIAYVRCYCPSTDRMFFLGVDEIHNTAKDAIASLYRIPSKLKTHIKSISRQGERFSTTLTEKGKEILKSMSEEEIADNSTLKGTEYFSLIKYEF